MWKFRQFMSIIRWVIRDHGFRSFSRFRRQIFKNIRFYHIFRIFSNRNLLKQVQIAFSIKKIGIKCDHLLRILCGRISPFLFSMMAAGEKTAWAYSFHNCMKNTSIRVMCLYGTAFEFRLFCCCICRVCVVNVRWIIALLLPLHETKMSLFVEIRSQIWACLFDSFFAMHRRYSVDTIVAHKRGIM